MLDLLGGRAITLADLPPADEDWYANLLWLDRQKCLLFTHAATLFSVFLARVRTADLRPLGPYVVKAIEAELRSESLPPKILGFFRSKHFSGNHRGTVQQRQSPPLDGLQVGAARNHRDLFSRSGEFRRDVPADRARAEDAEFHTI